LSRFEASRRNRHLRSRLNVPEEIAWHSEGTSNNYLRKNVVLSGLTEISRTFVFYPNKRVIGIVALIVHH
jgi:hypothetical protein